MSKRHFMVGIPFQGQALMPGIKDVITYYGIFYSKFSNVTENICK